MIARAAAAPSSSAAGAPALRALRRFFIFAPAGAGHLFFLVQRAVVQRPPSLVAAVLQCLNRCCCRAPGVLDRVDKPPRVI